MSGSIPDNVVASNGVGVISDSQANTYVQVGGVVANLRAFGNALTGMSCFLQGYTAAGDGGAGLFYWNPSATADDDGGVTTIQPNGVTVGRWLRDDPGGAGSQEWNAGSVVAVGANLAINAGGTLNATGTVGVSSVTAGNLLGGGGSGAVTLRVGTLAALSLIGNPGSVAALGGTIGIGSGFSITGGNTLNATSGEWSAGAVSGLALGFTISGTTLTPPSSAFGVGTYLWAQYHAAATPVAGTAYAGSTLYNNATGSSFSASGTWRCMGPQNAYTAPCCAPTYSTALFLRIA
jgi:hypothetical protein